MGISTILGVTACKATRGLLRIAKRGGTTVPGRAAMVFDKNILAKVSENMDTIIVTGTNGKTTTCRMLEQALSKSLEGTDKTVLANKSGANLLKGVTAEFTANATFTGKPKSQYAIIECDEGALKQVAPLVKPKVILVTNLFRDQLDRYGEVTHTLEHIRIGIEKVPKATICLNADCSLVSSLAKDIPNEVIYYGIDCPYGDQSDPEISDAKYCINCGTEYEYDYHTYAHLGGFKCPKCGYKRHATDVAVTSVDKLTAKGTELTMEFSDSATGGRVPCRGNSDNEYKRDKEPVPLSRKQEHVLVGLPAIYNVYNAVGAICAYTAAGFERADIIKSLAETGTSFGRMETFKLDGVDVQMILVKNPAGCNQAINYVTSIEEDKTVAVCLNDRTADGHDISWIWDAEYERIAEDDRIKNIIVSGDRAEDIGLRLKYGGVDESRIEIVKGWDNLINRMKQSDNPVFVLPNYTSMTSLRAPLAEITGKGEFWKG